MNTLTNVLPFAHIQRTGNFKMRSTLTLIGLVFALNLILVLVIAMGGTHLPPEAAWVAGFLTLLPLVWIRAMYVIAQDQNAREASFEVWVEENCECGIDQSGNWNEFLFDQCGCDCELPVEEDFNASDLDWEGGALEADSKYAIERGE